MDNNSNNFFNHDFVEPIKDEEVPVTDNKNNSVIDVPNFNPFGSNPNTQESSNTPLVEPKNDVYEGNNQPFNPLGTPDSYNTPSEPVEQFNPLGNTNQTIEYPVKEILPTNGEGNDYMTDEQKDEELLKAFIGPNYEKFGKIFNWSAYVFTGLYFLYRKMILFTILIFIFQVLLLITFKSLLTSLVMSVIVGFLANPLYIFHAKVKIDKIKRENPNADMHFYKQKCSSVGGTSFVYPIGLIILYALLYSWALKTLENAKTASILFDENVIISNDLDITVPEIFTEGKNSKPYFYYYESNTSCAFVIYSSSNYNDENKIVQKMYEEFLDTKEKAKPTNENINKISWQYITFDKEDNRYYLYASRINNKLYVLRYIEDPKEEACETARTELINSIKKK